MCDPQRHVFEAVGPGLALRRSNCEEKSGNYSRCNWKEFLINSRKTNLGSLVLIFLLLLSNKVTLTSAAAGGGGGLRLSDHVTHFEPALYDVSLLLRHHGRAKRDAEYTVALDFTAHNREFKIRLRRDAASVFADDVILESDGRRVDYDFARVYSGTLQDDERVEVSGIIDSNGLFDGHVSTPHELYYVEPADRYLSSPTFHSVIYKASDVLHPQPARCSSQQLHLRGKVHNPWVDPKRKEVDCDPEPVEETTPLSAEPIPSDTFNPGGQAFEAVHLPVVDEPQASASLSSSGIRPQILPLSDPSHPPLLPPNTPILPPPHHPKFHPKLMAVNRIKESNRHSMNADNSNFDINSSSSSSDNTMSKLRRKASIIDRKSRRHFRRKTRRQKHFYGENFRAHFKSRRSFLERSFSPKKSLTKKTFESNQRVVRKLYRKRRAAVDPKKTTCMLYLQADHLFYRQEGTEEACIDKITRHVQRVNNIYKVTDFDHDGGEDHIGFMIKRIKIHTENATRDPGYRFPGNYGVEKYLELFSEEDYDAFCLAYMFTYRDFEGGTLGLAWTGDLKNAGGVCEKNGHYRGSLKSLNTGIVTLLNYGKKVPPAVSHVTLAHEIGHNFGSPHDPEEDLKCTPGGEDGNYIMFARATSGDKRNNNKFSPCSLSQINNVLNSKARDKKGCFTEPQRAICGNGVVEQGEECDCGWTEDCEEKCCIPMSSNQKPGEKPCTLRRGKVCSPSQGPCCTYDCEVKRGDLCREDNGCRDASFCDGKGPHCPPSINKPNKTICKDEFVCYRGECTGSICLAYGLESCQCSRRSGDPDTKSCELCCKLPGEDQTCLSSFDWNVKPYNIPDLFAKPGTPCDNYKGYCDVFQKCREVDPSGPLATLRKILLSNESLATIQRWIVTHWYAVLFLVLALLVILVVITKVFGKQVKVKPKEKSHRKTGKKKKRKTIMHENGTPTQNFLAGANGTTPDGTNLVVHPTVIRANIPFKRKVNEVKRAATKAKRVARSQLGKPYKKSGGTSKKVDGGVTSPNDSEKSVVPNGKVIKSASKMKVREKTSSSRFSIYSFKTFRPKASSSPEKKGGGIVKNKSSTSVAVGKRSRSKSKSNLHAAKSPDRSKTRRETDAKLKNHSPSKRMSLEDDRKKLKRHTLNDDKHDKSKMKSSKEHKNLIKSSKQMDGNWLINKFLADEEKLNKPNINNSIPGSLNGSLSSISGKLSGNGVSNEAQETSNATVSGWISGTPSGSLSCSPIISHTRNGSTRALITPSSSASPIRGVINEAFIASPRGARTNRMHSSLRGIKSTSPDNIIMHPCQYRRSISMETRQLVHPDRRKRKPADEGKNIDKKRRFTSPDKSHKPSQQFKNDDRKHKDIYPSSSEKSSPVADDDSDVPPPLPERNKPENIRPPCLPEKLKPNTDNQFPPALPLRNSKSASPSPSADDGKNPSPKSIFKNKDVPMATSPIFKNKDVTMETSPDEGISQQAESSGSSSSAASLSNSLNSFNSFSSIPDRIREKLSLISSSSKGSNPPKVAVSSSKKADSDTQKTETCAVIPGANKAQNWV